MNRISFLNRGYAFKGLLAVGNHSVDWAFFSDTCTLSVLESRKTFSIRVRFHNSQFGC